MELYHGSNVTVANLQILVSGFYKDFGYGFYCTKLEKQARKWALTKKDGHVVSVYSYNRRIRLYAAFLHVFSVIRM